MSRYYNVLFISDNDDNYLNVFKGILKQVGINALVHDLNNIDNDINFYDLAFFNLRKIGKNEKYKDIFHKLKDNKIPVVSLCEFNKLNQDNIKELFNYDYIASAGYVSQNQINLKSSDVIGDISMFFDKFKNKYAAEEEARIIPFKEYILINYTLFNKLENIDYVWINEQIEIFIQYLLNNGNNIIITSLNEREKCKQFLNQFQNDNIKYIGVNDKQDMFDLISNSSMVVDMGTSIVPFALGFGRPFMTIGCDLDFLDLKSIVNIDDLFISAFDINAGKLIKSIDMIENNYEDISKKMLETVEHYYNLSLDFFSKIFEENTSKNSVIYIDKRKNKSPLVSIVVLAYNHLEFTKKCINSILKYTEDVNYELILVNNGSTDDTMNYFNSFNDVKIIDIKNNVRAANGFNEGIFYSEGKYIAGVCNDFIFSYNWLSNLIKCIESDDKIGYVSPGANLISNYQQINLEFNNEEEMHIKAREYNKSDSSKWEERVRLLPCVLMCKAELLKKIGGYDPVYYYGEFGDDDISFRIRRLGYKLVYAGDTFTYHFGHLTSKKAQIQNNSLGLSKQIFINRYGIDSWIEGMFNPHITKAVNYKLKNVIRILGINTFCGGTTLQIKNSFRKININDVKITSFTEKIKYVQDLKTVSDHVYYDNLENMNSYINNEKFDYIILENGLEYHKNLNIILNELHQLLKHGGQMIINIFNQQYIYNLLNHETEEIGLYGNECNRAFIQKDKLVDRLSEVGFRNIVVLPNVNYLHNREDMYELSSQFKNLLTPKIKDLLKDKLSTYTFLISVEK